VNLELGHDYISVQAGLLEMNVIGVQLVENITVIRVVLYGIEIWSVERNLDFSARIVPRNQNGNLTLQPILNVNT
jgi:hypothetical protein